LYLAAYLKAKGLKLIDKKRGDNKISFIFEDRQDRENLIREFFNDGMIGIAAFKNAIQDLKTVIYNW